MENKKHKYWYLLYMEQVIGDGSSPDDCIHNALKRGSYRYMKNPLHETEYNHHDLMELSRAGNEFHLVSEDY